MSALKELVDLAIRQQGMLPSDPGRWAAKSLTSKLIGIPQEHYGTVYDALTRTTIPKGNISRVFIDPAEKLADYVGKPTRTIMGAYSPQTGHVDLSEELFKRQKFLNSVAPTIEHELAHSREKLIQNRPIVEAIKTMRANPHIFGNILNKLYESFPAAKKDFHEMFAELGMGARRFQNSLSAVSDDLLRLGSRIRSVGPEFNPIVEMLVEDMLEQQRRDLGGI